MSIAIRFDADKRIGMGHAVRCSVIAREMMGRGCECTCYCRANGAIAGYLGTMGIPLVDVPDMPIPDEAAWLAQETSAYDAVILDSYEFTDGYIRTLDEVGNILCCIDDNADHIYNCDIVLNQNLYAKEINFETGDHVPDFLLGGEYCLLREGFRNAEQIQVKPIANRIFICFGGSDGLDYTTRAADILSAMPDTELTVVLGPAALDSKGGLNAELLKHPPYNANVYHNPPSMSALMSSCDMAVIASGSMVYEASSMGLPMIVIVQADNQKNIASYLEQHDAAIAFADYPPQPDKLYGATSALMHDFDRRQRMHDISLGLVNKDGVSKVAGYVINAAAGNNGD